MQMKRGQIWYYCPSTERDGHLQKGKRPVIIVSNNVANAVSPVVIVVPCTTSTTKKNKHLPTHVNVSLGGNESVIMCEQVCTVNKGELIKYIGTVPLTLVAKLDRCLAVALGLTSLYLEPKNITDVNRIKWTPERMACFVADKEAGYGFPYFKKKYGLNSPDTVRSYCNKFRRRLREIDGSIQRKEKRT